VPGNVRLCGASETCYEKAMKSMPWKFRAALLLAVALAYSANAGETKPVGQLAQVTQTNAAKPKNTARSAADKTGETVKGTTKKAIDAGKVEMQKARVAATNIATNVTSKATTLATNVAAKAKAGAQKVEDVATNILGEIKEKATH
jgi:hypothetical protein